MAAGVLMAAHQRGIKVPEQLSVAGFDDAQIARLVWPRLTTVFQPAYDLAYAATDMLLQMLKAPKPATLPAVRTSPRMPRFDRAAQAARRFFSSS